MLVAIEMLHSENSRTQLYSQPNDTEHFVCGHFRYRLPILPDERDFIMQVVLKIGLLQ